MADVFGLDDRDFDGDGPKIPASMVNWEIQKRAATQITRKDIRISRSALWDNEPLRYRVSQFHSQACRLAGLVDEDGRVVIPETMRLDETDLILKGMRSRVSSLDPMTRLLMMSNQAGVDWSEEYDSAMRQEHQPTKD